MLVLACQQLRPVNLYDVGEVVCQRRADEHVARHLPQEVGLRAYFPSFHRALVVVVVGHFVAYSPETFLEVVGRHFVVNASPVVWEDVGAEYADGV